MIFASARIFSIILGVLFVLQFDTDDLLKSTSGVDFTFSTTSVRSIDDDAPNKYNVFV